MRILSNLNVSGFLDIDTITNAAADTDKFLVTDANGVVRFRTGVEVASDIGAVTSVGLTMPSAFGVSNSPVTSSGTLAVTALGNSTQYIRGDGVLATLPTGGTGGGASVSYYLNGSINQGTIGGVTYYEMNRTPIFGAGTDFSTSTNGYITSFLTDANDPSLLSIPAGNFNFETYFQASSGGGSPSFYVELYKYDGTTFTLIASNSGSPKIINDGTSVEAYFSALAVPQTTLTLTDRLAIRIYVTTAGRTITLHTENNTLCQVITTFTTGLTALNGLTSQVQFFATGTSGTDFNISSVTDTHTFNLPTASGTNRGLLSSADWTTFNNKQNALTLTTTGTSGAATLIGSTLNIPQYQAYIASGATTQILRGDGSLYTFPLAISSPSNGQVLKYNGTSWVNDSDSGITGSLTTNYLPKATGATTLGNSLVFDNGTNILIGTTTAPTSTDVKILLNSVGGSFIGFGFNTLAGSAIGSTAANSMAFFTASGSLGSEVYTERMRLTATNGNLHIGTFSSDSGEKLQVTGDGKITGSVGIGVSPSRKLHVLGGAGTAQIQSSGTYSHMYFGDANSSVIDNQGIGSIGNSLWFSAGGFQRMTLDASGNLGLAVTPSAWSLIKALQIEGAGFGGLGSTSYVTANAYFDGSAYKYINSQYASLYTLNNTTGQHQWSVAPLGSANAAITFTQAMTLDASGNLGVGTANPVVRLHIENTNTSTSLFGNVISTFRSQASGRDINLQFSDGTNQAYIGSISGSLYFGTNGATEAMRITASRNLHIGTFTSDSGEKLQVNGTAKITGAASFNTSITNGGWSSNGNPVSAGTAQVFNRFLNTSGDFYVGLEGSTGGGYFNGSSAYASVLYSNQPIQLITGGVKRLDISSAGAVFSGAANIAGNLTVDTDTLFVDATNNRVGIGTAIPSEVLSISTGGTGTGVKIVGYQAENFLSLNNVLSTGNRTFRLIAGITSVGYDGFSIFDTVANDTRFIIHNTGNVSIGSTTDSGEKLQVTGTMKVTGNDGYIFIKESGGADVYLRSAYGGTNAAIQVASASPLLFITNNTERSRITSAGNTILAYTGSDSGERLQVNGTAKVTGALTASSGVYIPNGTYYYAKRSSGSADINVLGFASGSNTLTIKGGTSGGANSIQFEDTGGVIATFNNGNLGIGTIPEAWWTAYSIKALQIGPALSLYSLNAGAGNIQTNLVSNAYVSSSGVYVYLNNDAATYYQQVSGAHVWYNAPSGSAGANITFTSAMVLTANSRLILNSSSDTGEQLQVTGTAKITGNVTVGERLALQPSGFGYNTTSYKTLIVGSSGILHATDATTLAFNVDLSSNVNGSFTGNGSEYFWRNVGSFRTPNSSNNGFETLFSWNSGGQLTYNNAATFNSSLTAGSAIITGNLTVDTNTLYVDATNNYVGIGTTTPKRNLDVSTTGSPEIVLGALSGATDQKYWRVYSANDILRIGNVNDAFSSATDVLNINRSNNVGIGTTSINAAAKLQVDSTTSGFLPPRMTATQRAAISTPPEGLIIFQTDGVVGLYLYVNSAWKSLAIVN